MLRARPTDSGRSPATLLRAEADRPLAQQIGARAQRAGGDLEVAGTTLENAVAIAEGFGRRGQLQMLLGEWSDVMAARGDLAQAYALSRRAVDVGRR